MAYPEAIKRDLMPRYIRTRRDFRCESIKVRGLWQNSPHFDVKTGDMIHEAPLYQVSSVYPVGFKSVCFYDPAAKMWLGRREETDAAWGVPYRKSISACYPVDEHGHRLPVRIIHFEWKFYDLISYGGYAGIVAARLRGDDKLSREFGHLYRDLERMEA